MSAKVLIKPIMVKLHIWELLRKIYYHITAVRVYLTMRRDFERLIAQVKESPVTPQIETVVFTGLLTTPQKPTLMRFIRKIAGELSGTQVVLLDETPRRTSLQRGLLDMPLYRVPRTIAYGIYDTAPKFRITREITDAIANKEYLTAAVDNLISKQPAIDKGYASALVYFYERMYQALMETYRPRIVTVWCQFPALHQVCAHVCRQHGVKVLYMEYGSLPGTFSLDKRGQMGESRAAVEYKAFLAQPVDTRQMRDAEAVLDYLYESQLNRNAQPSNKTLDRLKAKLRPNMPRILFAGQNDFDSGFYPYNEHARTYHSPLFPDSWTAMEHLAELAMENGWELIFKPHPQMYAQSLVKKPPAGVHLVTDVDVNALIDMADVVVTIVSQMSYVALIRERPVVMLGYNQLRGKGCTYEAFLKDDMQRVILSAIQEGYTASQREAFIRHTAQMLADCLYDDMTERPLQFGLDASRATPLFT